MTKEEYKKCEKLMYEAIQSAKQANEELEKSFVEEDEDEAAVLNNLGFQHAGYADGINQVLATIGFDHKDMEKLSQFVLMF